MKLGKISGFVSISYCNTVLEEHFRNHCSLLWQLHREIILEIIVQTEMTKRHFKEALPFHSVASVFYTDFSFELVIQHFSVFMEELSCS